MGQAAASLVDDMTSLFTPPAGKEWFATRTTAQAESLMRGDLPLTAERFDPMEVAECPIDLRFAHGTASLPIFAEIARNLASMRGEEPDILEGVGHSLFYHPDRAAQYIVAWG